MARGTLAPGRLELGQVAAAGCVADVERVDFTLAVPAHALTAVGALGTVRAVAVWAWVAAATASRKRSSRVLFMAGIPGLGRGCLPVRQVPLVQQQLVSKAQYDQAIAQRDSLRAQLATARRNTQVAADNLAVNDIYLDHTVVRAPFAGVVIAKAAQPGEIVSPLSAGGGFTRTGIGTIVDMDSLEVEVEVGEQFIGRVQPKMPIEATLNAYQDWKIPGEVIAIIPTADRSKATVKVRVALDTKDARIVPDMGVKVSFLEAAKPAGAEKKNEGVRAPAAAIASRGESDVVFVVGDDDTVEQRNVKLGREMGEDRQVLQGLSAGESVVLNPPDELKDGMKVKMAEDAAE